MNIFYGAVIAFSMYSRIPMPKVEWTKERMRYLFCFFPLIGAATGALMLLWMRFGPVFCDGAFFTAVWIVLPVLVTGGIHLDGFLDTADALASCKPKEEKLRILKDSHAGAFAIVAGICYFVLEFGAYSGVDERTMPVLAAGFVLSRALSALAVVHFRMAKGSGLAAAFSDAAQKRAVSITMMCYIFACLAAMVAAGGLCGLSTFLAAVLVFGYYRVMSYREFGGITGDLAGFFLQVSELAMAMTAVISARFM